MSKFEELLAELTPEQIELLANEVCDSMDRETAGEAFVRMLLETAKPIPEE